MLLEGHAFVSRHASTRRARLQGGADVRRIRDHLCRRTRKRIQRHCSSGDGEGRRYLRSLPALGRAWRIRSCSRYPTLNVRSDATDRAELPNAVAAFGTRLRTRLRPKRHRDLRVSRNGRRLSRTDRLLWASRARDPGAWRVDRGARTASADGFTSAVVEDSPINAHRPFRSTTPSIGASFSVV